MLKLEATACIDAPHAMVWEVLSQLDAIHLWVEAIERSHCPGQRRGVGASRVCELKQATILETIVTWEEGRSFTYRGEGVPMMKEARNTWSVEPRGERQTLVTSTASVTFKGGFAGRLLEPLLKPLFVKLGGRSLASLKFFVEHGAPYGGRSSELPAVPVACY